MEREPFIVMDSPGQMMNGISLAVSRAITCFMYPCMIIWLNVDMFATFQALPCVRVLNKCLPWPDQTALRLMWRRSTRLYTFLIWIDFPLRSQILKLTSTHAKVDTTATMTYMHMLLNLPSKASWVMTRELDWTNTLSVMAGVVKRQVMKWTRRDTCLDFAMMTMLGLKWQEVTICINVLLAGKRFEHCLLNLLNQRLYGVCVPAVFLHISTFITDATKKFLKISIFWMHCWAPGVIWTTYKTRILGYFLPMRMQSMMRILGRSTASVGIVGFHMRVVLEQE